MLVAAAALSAPAEGFALYRPPRYKGPRCARVADGASRVGLLALALVGIRVVSLHVFATGTSRKAVWTWHNNRAERYDALKWHAYQFGWDAMVPMALLGVPAQQFSPPFRALGLSHEAAMAFHRVLGRATLILATLHVTLYLLVWGLEGGLEKIGDEALSACHGSARVSHRPSELFAHACGAQAPSRNISFAISFAAFRQPVIVPPTRPAAYANPIQGYLSLSGPLNVMLPNSTRSKRGSHWSWGMRTRCGQLTL